MNSFELNVWNDEATLCTFYTVQWEGVNDSETDKFFSKYGNENSKFCDETTILYQLIEGPIGEKYGAIDELFDRQKNYATALPPKPKRSIPEVEELGINFPLRLYCLRISDSIVILFNGGIKDAQTDQESKDISLKFSEAQSFAKRITEALSDGMILISSDGKSLTDFNGLSEIIL